MLAVSDRVIGGWIKDSPVYKNLWWTTSVQIFYKI